jgi:hypothetical protein
MKNLVAIAAVIGGLLLLLVPRYILPACEYEGFARMHCSDTAQAEYSAGALLIATGAVAFFLKQQTAIMACAGTGGVLFGLAYWFPAKFGYCRSPQMPCNYGMVPGIRFVAVLGLAVMIVALVSIARSLRKKGYA